MMLNNYFVEHIVGSNDIGVLNSSYIKVYLHVQFGISFWVYYLALAPENTVLRNFPVRNIPESRKNPEHIRKSRMYVIIPKGL